MAVLELAARVEDTTGVPALSDHLRLDLVDRSAAPPPLVVTVTDADGPVAFAQVSGMRTAVKMSPAFPRSRTRL